MEWYTTNGNNEDLTTQQQISIKSITNENKQ